MSYRAPVSETMFFLEHCTAFNKIAGQGAQAELSSDLRRPENSQPNASRR